jgi:hypothetical protein
VTKRRIDIVWDGSPSAELRQAVEKAMQKGAVSLGYLGSVRLRVLPDGRVQVMDTMFSAFADPWRGNFPEPETARLWLVSGLGADQVLGS